MNINIQINLTKALAEGCVLTVNQNGGLYCPKGQKIRTQKMVQSIHHLSTLAINHFLNYPSAKYNVDQFKKLSSIARIKAHIEDICHDMRGRGVIVTSATLV